MQESTDPNVVNKDQESFRSPLPRPHFYPQIDFSTKREKVACTPQRYRRIPRSARTAPTISRTNAHYRQKGFYEPCQITFKDVPSNAKSRRITLTNHQCYDKTSSSTFYDQCFTPIRELGHGSFGEVFAVKSREDGRCYAIKKAFESFRNASDRDTKLREVQKHELLPAHTNLVEFCMAWEERDRLYIQTELCDTSLAEYCSRIHELSEDEVWNFFLDLLMAVDHLHSHDLLHMDIKPENILLTNDKVCKLGDFGLIFDLKNDKMSSAEEGDSKYLSPEVLNGQIGKAADIFSLGITILEIATDLDLPSGGDSWQKLRNSRFPEDQMRHMSFDLRRIVKSMMSPYYKDRPSTEELLREPAVMSRMKGRTRQLHIHEFKTFVGYHLQTVWIYVVLILTNILGYITETMHWRHVRKSGHEGSHTDGTLFRGNRGISNANHTPETSSPQNFTRRFDDDLDYGFSDEENFAMRHQRHAATVGAGFRRRGPNFAASISPSPLPRHRLNFDDDDDENTPTSTSDANDSPPACSTPRMNETYHQPVSVCDSPLSSPRRSVRCISERRPLRHLGSGDGLPQAGGFSDDDGSDFDELVIAPRGAMTCPTRIPLRTQLRNRGILRPRPRLNFDLLDSPEKPERDHKQPVTPPPTAERRRPRTRGRLVLDRDSSAEE